VSFALVDFRAVLLLPIATSATYFLMKSNRIRHRFPGGFKQVSLHTASAAISYPSINPQLIKDVEELDGGEDDSPIHNDPFGPTGFTKRLTVAEDDSWEDDGASLSVRSTSGWGATHGTDVDTYDPHSWALVAGRSLPSGPRYEDIDEDNEIEADE
jgi:hypothetical protein